MAVEYKEVVIDLSTGGYVQYNWNGPFSSLAAEQTRRLEAESRVRTRVDAYLTTYLDDGWMLDGPFDSAVRVDWSQHNGPLFMSFNSRADRAYVRLRRYR